ncbi:glycoside hydrolase family 26 protein [Dactylosporangium sp. NBC_01737]|uniref:glycoside hydrolase family 26 protein n=1 Tax=Dactylosporangium sp. NBC_01737 TaxID=2975959 RepID=UPI002E13BCDB|nr:glycoside hydrolase family 26 protein [Dactylosporangium sp. NBC_01737]
MRMRTLLCAVVAAVALVVSGAAVADAAPAAAGAGRDASPTRYLGMFREEDPTAVAASVRSLYGVTPASVMWFDSWASGRAFPVDEARMLWRRGIMPHYTWEPWDTALGPDDPAQIHLQDVIDGSWDAYITARAREFAAVRLPILVRWGHEFNGNWYPWGIANNNADPSLYVRAYRHVHDLVVAAGARNVQWVWAFNNGSSPDAAYNDPARAYPGDGYVDWVGIDGYNWGFGPSWDPAGDHWTTFTATFDAAYAKARAVAPGKPVMIGEFASTEDGGDKAQWLKDMDTTLRSGAYPDLRLLTYFDLTKEEAWSPNSSPAALAAFRSWVHRQYMNGRGGELARIAAHHARS